MPDDGEAASAGRVRPSVCLSLHRSIHPFICPSIHPSFHPHHPSHSHHPHPPFRPSPPGTKLVSSDLEILTFDLVGRPSVEGAVMRPVLGRVLFPAAAGPGALQPGPGGSLPSPDPMSAATGLTASMGTATDASDRVVVLEASQSRGSRGFSRPPRVSSEHSSLTPRGLQSPAPTDATAGASDVSLPVVGQGERRKDRGARGIQNHPQGQGGALDAGHSAGPPPRDRPIVSQSPPREDRTPHLGRTASGPLPGQAAPPFPLPNRAHVSPTLCDPLGDPRAGGSPPVVSSPTACSGQVSVPHGPPTTPPLGRVPSSRKRTGSTRVAPAPAGLSAPRRPKSGREGRREEGGTGEEDEGGHGGDGGDGTTWGGDRVVGGDAAATTRRGDGSGGPDSPSPDGEDSREPLAPQGACRVVSSSASPPRSPSHRRAPSPRPPPGPERRGPGGGLARGVCQSDVANADSGRGGGGRRGEQQPWTGKVGPRDPALA